MDEMRKRFERAFTPTQRNEDDPQTELMRGVITDRAPMIAGMIGTLLAETGEKDRASYHGVKSAIASAFEALRAKISDSEDSAEPPI